MYPFYAFLWFGFVLISNSGNDDYVEHKIHQVLYEHSSPTPFLEVNFHNFQNPIENRPFKHP